MSHRQIFLDTETTGLSPETGDRVVEIGCVEMVNRRLTGEVRHYYLNPERPNSEDALRVHGLTDEFLAGQPKFAAVADEFVDWVAGAELVIHNAAFDVGFLNEELRRLGRAPLSTVVDGVLDTLLMAREMFPGKANSLDALCRRLEVDNSSRTLHGALLDAGLLAEVYINLTRGQNELVMHVHQEAGRSVQIIEVDLSTFDLPVLLASDAESDAHDAVLADLDKSSSGATLWRNMVA